MPRSFKTCAACGDEKAIVAKGFCANCYMRHRRAEDTAAGLKDLWAKPAKHNVDKQKRQKKARNAIHIIRDRLEELESPPFMSSDDVNLIRDIIKPYLELSTLGLNSEYTEAGRPETADGLVPGEPAGTASDAAAARKELDQLAKDEKTIRAEVESALRNLAYPASVAKEMAQSAVGSDLKSMLRDALASASGTEQVGESKTPKTSE